MLDAVHPQSLNRYLEQLLELPEIRQSMTLREFLEDSRLSDDSDDDNADNPPARMLEGLPGTIVTVRAGQSFSVSLTLPSAGDLVSWQFTTKKHNIGFSATFNGDTIRVYSREDSQLKPIKGFYKCSAPGVCTLNWDNTYTWSKGKVLVYWAEVEQNRATTNAVVGGGAAATGRRALSSSEAANDARRSGYIEKNRNHSLYPRQIVNSSISLITKPFVSSGKTNRQQFKSGSLIVERNIKFRGRNWYRKWFVLDTRKCVLRYYDSESAARKGLSISTLNLNHKNASLAVTRGEETAPTPYVFIARTRKRCWKLCASSLAEYNEWEHAISTAILTAQLSKRRRSGGKDAAGAVGAPSGVAVDGARSDAHDLQVPENKLLHGHREGADDSEDSDDDDSEDDDDDERAKEDGESEASASENEVLARDSDLPVHRTAADSVVGTRARGVAIQTFADLAGCVSAWESKWKVSLVCGVNAALVSVRFLPVAVVATLLLVYSGCVVLLKIVSTARLRTQTHRKGKQE